ncbi:MAG: hypothetical protein ABIE74_04555 [Pseudomonadota bacterium]
MNISTGYLLHPNPFNSFLNCNLSKKKKSKTKTTPTKKQPPKPVSDPQLGKMLLVHNRLNRRLLGYMISVTASVPRTKSLMAKYPNTIMAKELEQKLKIGSLDGKPGYSLVENRVRAHIYSRLGVISPMGVMFYRPELSQIRSTLRGLYSVYSSAKGRKQNIQQVYIFFENWNKYCDAYGIAKDKKVRKQLITRMERKLQIFYTSESGKPLNISFKIVTKMNHFDSAKANKAKIVLISSPERGKGKGGGHFLNALLKNKLGVRISKTQQTFFQQHANKIMKGYARTTLCSTPPIFYFKSWMKRRFPKIELVARLQKEIWENRIFNKKLSDETVILRAITDPKIAHLILRLKKPEGKELLHTINMYRRSMPKALAEHILQKLRYWQQEFKKSHFTQRIYEGAELKAANFLMFTYYKKQLKKFKKNPKAIEIVLKQRFFKKMLIKSMNHDWGMALIGCKFNSGNRRSTGYILLSLNQRRKWMKKHIQFERLVNTIAHEVGHTLGLQHHYVGRMLRGQLSSKVIKGKKYYYEPTMVAGPFRYDSNTAFQFSPPNKRVLRWMLGTKR